MGARKKSHHGPKPPPPTASVVNQTVNEQVPIPDKDDKPHFEMSNISSGELKDYDEGHVDMYSVVYSMYRDGFERIYGKRGPWQRKDNLAFSVTITSSLNREFHAKMEFEIPQQFPKLPVKAKLLQLKPHLASLQERIDQLLTTYPEKNTHEATITDMIMIVQEYIDQEAAENEVDTQGMSLKDERAHQEAMARDHERAQREYELRKREEEEIAREKRLQEAILREKQRRHGQYSSQEGEEVDLGADQDVSEIPFRFKDRIKYQDPSSKTPLLFSAVFGHIKLLERRDKKVTLVHPVKFGKLLPGSFVLKEIFLPDFLASKAAMETAMDSIRKTLEDCKTTQHPHIAKMYAYQIEHDVSEEDLPEWKVTILTEKAPESGLEVGLKMSGCFKAQKARMWTEQLLQAMDFLDRLGHPHPAVHMGNILYWHGKDDNLVLKLTDGYGSALRDLVEKVRERDAPTQQVSPGWVPPELLKGGSGRSSKTCVWQLGIVLIKMAFYDGLKLEEVHTSVDPLLARDDLREPFKAFLRGTFQSLPRKRPSPGELLPHQMLKGGSEGFNIPTRENPSDEPTLLRSGELATANSNWHKLFIEASPLGAGGFGQVFKARYLMDMQLYAVKRLVCASREDVKAIWSEVHLLAKLNHPGVVRYYNAWQEDEDIDDTVFERVKVPQPSAAAQSVRNRLLDPSTLPSAGHDFMDPSMHRNIGAEYNTDDERNENEDEDTDSDSDEDDSENGGMFGYQSPPEDIDDDDEAFQEDPVSNFDSLNNFGQMISSDDFGDNIQFGDDTSSANKGHGSVPDAKSLSRVKPPPARKPAQRSILYIQMELCQDGTLKDLIVDGLPNRISEVWRVFREILEALAHIHSHGVVHRDLKPGNIFIDQSGHAKIGDFGLAITSHPKSDSMNKNVLIAGSERGVGTQWYVAPELDDHGSGEYSSKADMFSLGVVFFQMCMPITTESERQTYLNQISKDPKFHLPAFFEQEYHRSQGRILASLINHDQNARPSSQVLLLDPDIPENLGEGTITRHIARLAIHNPEQLTDLVNKIYIKGLNYTQAQDLAWQNRGHKSDFMQETSAVTTAAVNDQLHEIFRRHGAMTSYRALPFPAAGFYSNAACFMDDLIVLQLPFDLTLPFARLLADPITRPEHPKNFCFGTVYRRAHRGIVPIRFQEVDYDHVSYSAKDLSLKDAEVVKVLDEVLTEQFALAPRSFTIVVNHGDLLDCILRFAQVKEDIWDNIKGELSQLNVRRIEWKHVRDQLLSPRYQMTQSSVSCLEKFNFQGDIATVKSKVNRLLDEDHAGAVVKTFARLEELMKFVELFDVKTVVQISPLSNNSEYLYKGSIMFKAIEAKSRKILVVGGRYDRLIETLSFGIPKGSVRAVGFRINVSVLNAYVMAENKKRHGGRFPKDIQAIPPRIDVLVTSFDEAVLRSSCIEIYGNLLACGIKAELSEHYNNMAELERYYGDLNYLIVIVRSGPRIKVRNLSREEMDVRPSELITHIKTELGDRHAPAATESKLRRVTSSHGEKATQRISVCNPSHKDKKANRSGIVDAAALAAQDLAEEMGQNAPIVAISTKDEVLELIRNTRLSDDGSWRALRQSVSAGERQYLAEVQELLQSKADEGAKGAFVVNYRTNSCIFYDLGKKA